VSEKVDWRPLSDSSAPRPGASAPSASAGGRWRWARVAVTLALCLLLGAPTPVPVVLRQDFTGPDGVFVDQSSFYTAADQGRSENPEWLAESGVLRRQSGVGRTDSDVFRMWTRRADLHFPAVTMDVRLRGFTGGDQPWHGINLWLNESLCTPVPDCSLVDDRGGVSGYALDFVNRDGTLTVLKKVPGDTRDTYPDRATSYVQGGTYYELATADWSPAMDRTYAWSAQAVDLGDRGVLLRLTVDDEILLEVLDSGAVGGPPLRDGGRVGLRGDHADFEVDDIRISRPTRDPATR
jgi:hypothetical protein